MLYFSQLEPSLFCLNLMDQAVGRRQKKDRKALRRKEREREREKEMQRGEAPPPLDVGMSGPPV
jgi:hypothetical protein